MHAPFVENIQDFISRLKAPFYCPGHKGGRSLSDEIGNSLGRFDLNNLAELDTLHCPSGSIREAEELLADAYGVLRSFMMVGGSSLGNMAALMSVAGPGDPVLVQRNAHKSVIAGLIHSGAIPTWLPPTWDVRFGVGHGLPVDTVQLALKKNPNAKALLALNPTYFGVVPDIKAIASACRPTGTALIVDEAHGPHFHFSESYPLAAEDAGADIVVQSIHKILSGLSQAAALHLAGPKVSSARVQSALQSLQTTSPNFAILASIDLSRKQMMTEGIHLLDAMRALANTARERINEIDGICVMGPEHSLGSGSGFYSMDPTKLLIDTSRLGWSGRETLRILNQEFGVQPELSGPNYVLCILTIGSIEQDVDCLVQALQSLCKRKPQPAPNQIDLSSMVETAVQQIPDCVMNPRDAFYAKQRTVPFERAIGRISGEIITPYPPGIPVVMPGERFDQQSIDLLHTAKHAECPISAVDATLETVRVIA